MLKNIPVIYGSSENAELNLFKMPTSNSNFTGLSRDIEKYKVFTRLKSLT